MQKKNREPRHGQATLEGAIDAADRGFNMFREEKARNEELEKRIVDLKAIKQPKVPKKSESERFWEACGKMQNGSMAVMMALPPFLEWIGTSHATMKFITDESVSILLQWGLTFLIAGIMLAGPMWWGVTWLVVVCFGAFSYIFGK